MNWFSNASKGGIIDLEKISLGINFNNILWAILAALILLIIIKYAGKVARRLLNKTPLDASIKNITLSLVRFALYFISASIVLDILGIPSSSLLAIFGTLGLAFSLAMQDSLANIAGGLLLLYTKPFSSGDFIEISGGISGTVDKIGFIHTSVHTLDNKRIFLPNGSLSKDKITNYSSEDFRQLEIIFPVSYNCDTSLAKEIILNEIDVLPYTVKDKPVFVRVWALSPSSVDIIARIWTKRPDFIEAKCALLENVKHSFDTQGISIPFNQLDVHIK